MPSPTAHSRSIRVPLWFGTAIALIALCIGIAGIYSGHPSEDAYILYKYADNIAAGNGICYYAGGTRAEGATDFLYMLLLGGLHRMGVDIPLGSLILNAIGAGLIAGTAAQLTSHASLQPISRIVMLFLCASALAMPASVAGYLGFGVTLYTGLCCLLLLCYLQGGRALVWMPVIGITIGLFRPDGVIIATAFCALGLARAWNGAERPTWLRNAGFSVLVGLVYLAWRRWYFGLPIPLPLYVKGYKGQGRSLIEVCYEASSGMLSWMLEDPTIPALIGFILMAAVLQSRKHGGRIGWQIAAILPLLIHVFTLATAHQTQNIAGRFQAPAQAGMWVLAAFQVSALAATFRSTGLQILCLASLAIPTTISTIRNLNILSRYVQYDSYVDEFAPRMGALLPAGRTVALTEAGRLAYWTGGRVEDLIGLNTPRIALAPPDNEYFEQLQAEVIMLHEGKMTLEQALNNLTGDVVEIEKDLLAKCVPPAYMHAFMHGIEAYDSLHNPSEVAPILAARFLSKPDSPYRLFAVRYAGAFHHVYAIRNDWPDADRLIEILKDCAEGRQSSPSYAHLAGYWGT